MTDNELVLVEYFEDDFYRELDHWLTDSIACCDSCFAEFVKQWPGLLRNGEFFGNGWTLEQIYTDSRLPELYSRDEYDRFVRRLTCPNCGQPFNDMIWTYHFVGSEFEDDFEEIHSLVAVTPSMVAAHPFAQDVIHSISELASCAEDLTAYSSYYRGQTPDKEGLPDSGRMLPLPKKTGQGRYNHAGRPVLYLGSSKQVCFSELSRPKSGIWAAKVELIRPVKLLNLMELRSGIGLHDCLIAVASSSLTCAPAEGEEWDRPQYTFTRFVADCARWAGFDGILYDSTKLDEGHNLVLFGWPRPWEETIKITSIEHYRAEDTKKDWNPTIPK